MRRFIIGMVVVAAMGLVVQQMAPAMRSRFAAACERMLAKMPESFPPNRMMADLEALKEQTARLIDLVDRPADDAGQSRSSSHEPSVSGPAHNAR